MIEETNRDNHSLTDAERARIRHIGFDRFCRENQRIDWCVTLASRHQIAIANASSERARISLVKSLLPDLFHDWRHFPLIRDDSLVPLAIDMVGPDAKHIRVHTPNGGEAGLRVAATSRPEALAHVRDLGIEPLVG